MTIFAVASEVGDGFRMQVFPLFCHGVSQGRGTSIEVPAVTGSELWQLIQSKFQALGSPEESWGAQKLRQQRSNPDLFDLYFFATGTSEYYRGGYSYSLPRIGTFELREFEQFPHGANSCEQRVDEFIRCLRAGELKRSFHEG